MLHEVSQRRLRIVQNAQTGVDDLGEVMRWDIGRHTDGDTRRAVDQQIREAGRQNERFLAAFVEVRHPLHRFLVDVAQHLVGELAHTRLGITVGGRGVSVDGAEVAVTVNELITHGEVLRQTHHGVIDGGVAVRVITTQHITDAGRGLLERLVAGQIVLIHCIQDAAVDGLQTVTHIRQCTGDNDGHRVFDEGGLHFLDEVVRHDRLIGILNILRLIITVFCHTLSPPQKSRLTAYLALRSINSFLGSTSSPIRTVKV